MIGVFDRVIIWSIAASDAWLPSMTIPSRFISATHARPSGLRPLWLTSPSFGRALQGGLPRRCKTCRIEFGLRRVDDEEAAIEAAHLHARQVDLAAVPEDV